MKERFVLFLLFITLFIIIGQSATALADINFSSSNGPASKSQSRLRNQTSTQHNHVVIFISGFASTGSKAKEDFKLTKEYIENNADPLTQFVIYSYTVPKYSLTGQIPYQAWVGNNPYTNSNAQPNYESFDTFDSYLSDQAQGLNWLVKDVLIQNPNAVIDIIGFSQGGVIAAYWGTSIAHQNELNSVHRIITLDSPISGVSALTRKCLTNGPQIA